jgi:hypothetical protein
VPDDPDGKCFWMYTGHFINNKFNGYVLMRSADPTKFCWDERESVSGTSEIGNQIGYISNYDGQGNRLFLRITFGNYSDKNGARNAPILQVSKDGRKWTKSMVTLAAVDVSDAVTERNRNTYFLGFTTLNGTGEIEKTADGKYQFLYFATTSNDSVVPAIWYAESGFGICTFALELK